MNNPAINRLDGLYERQHEISQEMLDSAEGGPDGFNNAEWLYAEAAAIDHEVKEISKIMTARGKIPYE